MDFTAYDLRVGTVVAAEREGTALRLTIDFGPTGRRASTARITERYGPDDVRGRQVVAVMNLPAADGEVVVLAALDATAGAVLLAPERPVPDGTPVV